MSELAGLLFVIIQVINTSSGLRMVHITTVPDAVACQELLSAATENDFGGILLFERADCVSELAPDYQLAFLDMPIPDTMIVAYDLVRDDGTWPVRHVFNGVAEQWQSQEGCDLLAADYRKFSSEVHCINGY